MDTAAHNRPVTQLLKTLSSQVQRLILTDVQLARAEVKENLAKSRSAVVLGFAGVALVIPALTIVLQAIVNTLSLAGVRSDVSGLVVGVGAALISLALILTGIKKAKAVNLIPDKAIAHFQRDLAAVNPMRSHYEHPTT